MLKIVWERKLKCSSRRFHNEHTLHLFKTNCREAKPLACREACFHHTHFFISVCVYVRPSAQIKNKRIPYNLT